VQLASSFAPKTPLGIFFRNQVTKAFKLPLVAKLAIGRSLFDRIDLPDLSSFSRCRPKNPIRVALGMSERASFSLTAIGILESGANRHIIDEQRKQSCTK